MRKLRDVIINKERWAGLEQYIEQVEENRDSNPNVAIDGAKSIIESISKTILEDRGIVYDTSTKVGKLVKKAFESLPVFSKISSSDLSSSKSILASFENVTRVIGEFRNSYGFFSHGQDLQSEKFDQYLVELAISSSDLLGSFLIISHDEDKKDRSRVFYEENDEFNRYIDETSEEYPVVRGIQLAPSSALFSDIEAYKEELNNFVNEKVDLIDRLEKSESFVSTRSICSELLPVQEYLTDDEIRKICRIGIDNPQVHRILGHGYTRNLFTWIVNERANVLSNKEKTDINEAFDKKMY